MKKKKVTLTLDPERYELLKRLAGGLGVSVSVCVEDLAVIGYSVATERGWVIIEEDSDGSR